MTRLDGRALHTPCRLETDVVVVGSGPAGAAAARVLTSAGAKVVVVEAGPWIDEPPLELGFAAMAKYYRSMGTSPALGSAMVPYIQGKLVGGSSPINGAICWRLPRDVWDGWVAADPKLADGLPWDALEAATDQIEARLGVSDTDPAIAGTKNLLMAKGADALGLTHRPIRRNVRGCRGAGRCLQGCPHHAKQSVDLTLLADALEQGATVLSSTEVHTLLQERGRVVGVQARAAGGSVVTVRARSAVVLAASAVQTPLLLLRNGISDGPVGHGFQGHPGVSMSGRFPEPVRAWEGATQGHEVIGLRQQGIKFETLGFGLDIFASRLPGVGQALAREVEERAYWLSWGAAIRATARGRVRNIFGSPLVTWSASSEDIARYRRGLRVLGELMFAAGAEWVSPGVRGFPARISSPQELAALEADGPRSATAFAAVITHMFGTCAAGSDPSTSVVRPDLRHHRLHGLYIADSSVFPTNIGVNPQIAIAAIATRCAHHVLQEAR